MAGCIPAKWLTSQVAERNTGIFACPVLASRAPVHSADRAKGSILLYNTSKAHYPDAAVPSLPMTQVFGMLVCRYCSAVPSSHSSNTFNSGEFCLASGYTR